VNPDVIDLGPFKKGRVWLGSGAPLPHNPCVHVREELAQKASLKADGPSRRVAIELCINRGPRSLYGLLGGEFVPDPSFDIVRVRLAVATRLEGNVEWSLAPKLDTVASGLLKDYAPDVLSAIESSQDLVALGSGTLTIDQAAVANMGSCSLMFRQLAIDVLRLLVRSSLPVAVSDRAQFLLAPSFVSADPPDDR
jgi:hypothetical protein